MRSSILVAIAAAAVLPGLAEASGHTERDRRSTVPEVRIHTPRAANAGTTWDAPNGMREEYRRGDRGEPLYADEGYADEYFGGGDDGPSYGDSHAYGVEDHAMSDRFVRDDRGTLDYDRDYPYDAPYGNYGSGGGYYTIVQTTVTTGPSVVTYAEEKTVAVRRTRRTVRKPRA